MHSILLVFQPMLHCLCYFLYLAEIPQQMQIKRCNGGQNVISTINNFTVFEKVQKKGLKAKGILSL